MINSRLYRRLFLLTVFLFISTGLFVVTVGPRLLHSPRQHALDHQKSPLDTYGKLPIAFEANQGQVDSSIKYLAHANRYNLFLTASDSLLTFGNQVNQDTLRLHLVRANPDPRLFGLNELPGKTNYFLGNDPRSWQTNLPTYTRVLYQNVYPGVNLMYYGNQSQLEYDFVAQPGVSPRMILLAVDGAKNVHIDAQGNLVLSLPGGEVIQPRPFIYQEVGNTHHVISGGYVLTGTNQVGFAVGAYDPTRALIIDPVLTYSTYLGGHSDEQAYGLAIDGSGNAYIVGYTDSANFPMKNAFQARLKGPYNVFVSKLNASGNGLVYSTYLGGSGADIGYSIAVDSAGNAYVTGYTSSSDFPLAHALQPTLHGSDDAFVTKLNASGSVLVYSTYLGGSNGDYGQGIAVDSTGNAYITGYTESSDFPLKNPLQGQNHTSNGQYTGFVSKLNANGSALVSSTYLGGSDYDQPTGIAVDSTGDAYITGTTGSGDFPVVNAIQKIDHHPGIGTGFISELNASGSALVFSTFLGGSMLDEGTAIAVDKTGQVYVTGFTESKNFPVKNPFQSTNRGGHETGFVSKLKAGGSAFVYSTYLGGTGHDAGNAIAVDSTGNAYITGYTDSKDFPLKNPLQPAKQAFADVFISEFNASGSGLVFSTYLGGSSYDDQGNGIAVDSAGNMYLTGFTQAKNFPVVNAFQKTFGGGSYDAFVAKIGP